MHLPESIELLRKLKNEQVNPELATKSSIEPLNDVEYEEDEEDISAELEALADETPQVNFPRRFSINLFNGSPILPNFERMKNSAT